MTAALGEQMHALGGAAVPALPEHHRRRRARRPWTIVGEHLPLQVHEVPTGTQVLDWTVPQEWNIRDAYVADPTGRRVVDFADVQPARGRLQRPGATRSMPLTELRAHLHTLPDQPDLVPYRTSYYHEAWGFCLAQRARWTRCPTATYEVVHRLARSPTAT